MRKATAVALVAVLLLGLTGCGSSRPGRVKRTKSPKRPASAAMKAPRLDCDQIGASVAKLRVVVKSTPLLADPEKPANEENAIGLIERNDVVDELSQRDGYYQVACGPHEGWVSTEDVSVYAKR